MAKKKLNIKRLNRVTEIVFLCSLIATFVFFILSASVEVPTCCSNRGLLSPVKLGNMVGCDCSAKDTEESLGNIAIFFFIILLLSIATLAFTNVILPVFAKSKDYLFTEDEEEPVKKDQNESN